MATEQQTDVEAVSDEQLDNTPDGVINAFREEFHSLKTRIDALEARRERYEILRDVVVSCTELDADTLDQLVEQCREDEGQ